MLTACLKRPADLAARYGGEEFALVLPDTDEAGARSVAENCLRALAELGMDNPQSPHRIVTMSIGMATLVPAAGNSPAELVESSDRALYAAKDGGRNRAIGTAAAQTNTGSGSSSTP